MMTTARCVRVFAGMLRLVVSMGCVKTLMCVSIPGVAEGLVAGCGRRWSRAGLGDADGAEQVVCWRMMACWIRIVGPATSARLRCLVRGAFCVVRGRNLVSGLWQPAVNHNLQTRRQAQVPGSDAFVQPVRGLGKEVRELGRQLGQRKKGSTTTSALAG